MKKIMPNDWIIAHRCVDLSDAMGKMGTSDIAADAKPQENTLESMKARFEAGFGIETDLRGDCRTENPGILISHDLPLKTGSYPTLEEVCHLYSRASISGCLALNIKDAGLQTRLKPLLTRHMVTNYFTFDGSNPDTMVDGKSDITAFGRESEIEPFNTAHTKHPLPNYPTIAGVWLDNLEPEFWITDKIVERHFAYGKDVAIVSPDLHMWGRTDKGETVLHFWTQYRETLKALSQKYPDRRMMICTKFSTYASRFFNHAQ